MPSIRGRALSSGLVSGGGAFTELERIAAQIDYSGDETNYTFALTTLAARLTRRSMIILFTEFTDSISADFLLRALRTNGQTASRCWSSSCAIEELESIVEREPQTLTTSPAR